MIAINEEFAGLEQAEPVHFRNLTLCPLLRPSPENPEPEYLLLEDAIRDGVASVTEINNGGSVPELRFTNRSERPVLILDGEELLGAKQNRVVNLTILAPAKQSIVIPVSCVESGRWNMESPEFATSPRVMYSKARAARASQVTASMAQTGARLSDQSALWGEIATTAMRLGSDSPTMAMGAIFERHSASIEEFVRAFRWMERQAGVLFAIDGEPLGMDLLDHPVSMQRLFPKLVRSYALDAVDAGGQKQEPASAERFSEFLVNLGTATSFAQPALGLGKDVRLTGRSASGAALWAEGRYVHCCAFRESPNGRGGQPSTRFSRPTRRFR